jgi:hypothetical protein
VTLVVKLIGTQPLLMHSSDQGDPDNEYVRARSWWRAESKS